MINLDFLEKLSNSFQKIPGVGKKTADRYSYQIAKNFSFQAIDDLIEGLSILKNVKKCAICGLLTTSEVCSICSSQERDKSVIMVVEDTKDVLAIEKTNQFHGKYHVLNGVISPLDGTGPEELNINSLEKRIDGNIQEVILALPFTPQGEITALYLEKILNGVLVSKIAYGLPAGGAIEYLDELTLSRALKTRINRK